MFTPLQGRLLLLANSLQTHTHTPTQTHLRLFIVALRDLIVGDVDEANFPLLVLQLSVKDLKTDEVDLPVVT